MRMPDDSLKISIFLSTSRNLHWCRDERNDKLRVCVIVVLQKVQRHFGRIVGVTCAIACALFIPELMKPCDKKRVLMVGGIP